MLPAGVVPVLTTTAHLVRAAQAAGGGVGAFNVVTLEHAEAIAAGAEAAGQPVILQVSQNAVRFHHGWLRPVARAAAEIAEAVATPVALHLDHVTDPTLVEAAADAGFSSVMFDAADLAYPLNVAATRAAARRAHRDGLSCEGELGEVGGKRGAQAPGVRTDPEQAAEYVRATGVDALAVAVGSRHAMTSRTAVLDLDLVARLARAVPVPLVLHGSSGVPDADLRAAVRGGVVKVNVGTALNVAYTGSIRAALSGDDPPVDPRRWLAGAREAVAGVVEHVLRVLATGGGH
jgi:fructose-bisphosphate aldolase class II